MNVLFIAIDSLRRDFLDTYAKTPQIVDYEVETPNIDRFANRAAVFDNHYAGSLPCMPARREWLTGTQEFLWRAWGPIEPFDEPLPKLARDDGVLTQLVTDHYHYFQHGSHGYYEDFNGFEFIRGHEHDGWQTAPKEPDQELVSQCLVEDATDLRYLNHGIYARNVDDFSSEEDFFAPKVFSRTEEWLRENQAWDRWLCFVDSFDVHEPFHCPEPYASMYTEEDPTDPNLPVWPFYGRVEEGQGATGERQMEFIRSQFAGKTTMVDRWFGRVLDALDEENLWDDTMVVVTADHGHYLGDHGWIGKPNAPLYDVLAHTPLLIWHPDSPHMGERLSHLTSAVDLYGTVLDTLELDGADHRHSESLAPLLRGEATDHRDWALYGYWGSSVNLTDGRFTYHHPCDEEIDAYNHSTSMMDPFSWTTPTEVRHEATSGRYLPYTESPVWRYSDHSYSRHEDPLLFDTKNDPQQEQNLYSTGEAKAEKMESLLRSALNHIEAPDHELKRLQFR